MDPMVPGSSNPDPNPDPFKRNADGTLPDDQANPPSPTPPPAPAPETTPAPKPPKR